MKFCHEILETIRYHMVKPRNLYLTWSCVGTGRDGQTDRQNYCTLANTRYSYASSRAQNWSTFNI